MVLGGVDLNVLGMGSNDEVTRPAAVLWCGSRHFNVFLVAGWW